MRRIYQFILLCYICLILYLLVDLGDASETKTNGHTRQRRYLSFKNGTKFFIRLNFKANMVEWNQIFAQAIGFRMNWDDPPDTFHPYHHLYRRTVYTQLETLLDKSGMDGYHCVRRSICEMASMAEPKSIYYKILKMVFRRQSSATDKWHGGITNEDCLASINQCPFSFLDISLYTDL